MTVPLVRTTLQALAGFCSAACLTCATLRADIVVTPNAPATPTLRKIVANATSVPNSSNNAPIENKTGGGFNDSQTGNAANGSGGAAVEAQASQNSAIPNLTGPTMSGTGSVKVTWNPGNNQAATADSLLDVFFTVDATKPYDFTGALTSDVKELAAITTLSASLEDTTNGNTLASHDTVGKFSDRVTLTVGNTYEIKLDALIDGNLPGVMGTKIEEAGWNFTLMPAPEPSTIVLAAFGVLGIGGWLAIRRLVG
jgi:hypothetical protein